MNDRKLRSIIVLNDETIEDLADFLGVTRQTLTNKMAGRTEFTRSEMVRIKEHYDLSDEEFIETFHVKG